MLYFHAFNKNLYYLIRMWPIFQQKPNKKIRQLFKYLTVTDSGIEGKYKALILSETFSQVVSFL